MKSKNESELLAMHLIKEDEILFMNIDPQSSMESLVKVDSVSRLTWWNRLKASGFTFFHMEE